MSERFRFIFCSTDGWRAFNGINAWLLRLLPQLRRRGHDARALLFAWSKPEDCMTFPALRAAGVPTRVIFPPRTTEASVRLALREARAFRPDVFVASAVVPALYAGAWLRPAGVATVAMVHNDDEEYRAKLEAFGAGPAEVRPSAIVAISQGLGSLARERAPGVPVRIIPYGVPVPATAASAPGPGRLRMVYHGRLAQEQKRIQETAEACLRAARRHAGLEMDFYGDGPDRLRLESLLARDDAGGRVRYRGPLPPAAVMAMLPRYHAAVLLSDYEGLGLSMLEAMACGVVPVCRRTASGLGDFLTDGETGLVVGDREAEFDRAIDRLLGEPGLWPRLSAAGRARAAEAFGEDAVAAAWESLAQSLAAAPAARRPVPRPWSIGLPAPHPALRREDPRFPGLARAVWRRLRFGSRQ